LLQDVRALLSASRELAEAEEFDGARLQQWSAERNLIFNRLEICDWTCAAEDSQTLEGLMRELLELDGKISARLLDRQKRLGEQIATSRKFRRTLTPAASSSPRLLQRLA
jgi:hypothetical protein